jgi:hypothetical protein
MRDDGKLASQQATEFVERLLGVPTEYRKFNVAFSEAVRRLGFPHVVLQQLIEHGLPHAMVDQRLNLDLQDLRNVALWLQLPSSVAVLHSLRDSLIAGEVGPSVSYTLNVVVRCPAPGHDGPCRFEFEGGPEGKFTATTEDRVLHAKLPIDLPTGRRYFTWAANERRLIEEVLSFDFRYLPHLAAGDPDFLVRTGMGDCRAIARYLARRGAELGVEVRLADGLFIAKPFSMAHSWVEFRVDDEWLPADPFLLTMLADRGIVDRDAWPVDRSPMGVYWRWPAGPSPAVFHRGTRLDASFVVS